MCLNGPPHGKAGSLAYEPFFIKEKGNEIEKLDAGDTVKLGKGNLSGRHKAALAMMFVGPLAVMLGKWSALPSSECFTRLFSLTGLTENMQSRVG